MHTDMTNGINWPKRPAHGPRVFAAEGKAPYAGDVAANEAFALLKENPKAVLVDVRSSAEWSFVGLPDLTSLGRQPLLIEWQSFPGMAPNPRFVEQTRAALAEAGVGAGDPVLFLCRSGARSRNAAIALTEAGFGACYNISDGFEGALDGERHRGRRTGWKAEGLPWAQN